MHRIGTQKCMILSPSPFVVKQKLSTNRGGYSDAHGDNTCRQPWCFRQGFHLTKWMKPLTHDHQAIPVDAVDFEKWMPHGMILCFLFVELSPVFWNGIYERDTHCINRNGQVLENQQDKKLSVKFFNKYFVIKNILANREVFFIGFYALPCLMRLTPCNCRSLYGFFI